jgi:hypothetical protein
MSRTLNGNLTGQAAATERGELVEFLIAESERARLDALLEAERDLMEKCIDIEGAPAFWEWYNNDETIPRHGSTKDRIELVRAHLDALPSPAAQLEAAFADCDRIQKWIADNWDAIPEIEV